VRLDMGAWLSAEEALEAAGGADRDTEMPSAARGRPTLDAILRARQDTKRPSTLKGQATAPVVRTHLPRHIAVHAAAHVSSASKEEQDFSLPRGLVLQPHQEI
jgi:hypothetical protein